MNTNIYIIEPLEHGNGGCHGSKVLAELTLDEALTTNPCYDYNVNEWGHPFGFWPRICSSKDMNDAIYIWNNDEWKLEKC